MDDPSDAPSPAGQDDADLRAYLLSLSSGPASERPPIDVRDITMVPLTQFFNDPPAQTTAGSPPAIPGQTYNTVQIKACDGGGSPILLTVCVPP